MGSSFVLLAAILLFAGLAGAALLARLLRDEPDALIRSDAAISLGLPVGLTAAALPGWLIAPFAAVPIGHVVLPLGAVALVALLVGCWKDLGPALRPAARTALPLAVVLLLFAFFLHLRYPTGDIRQTEKPMDFAVLNTVLTAPSLPVGDPWLAGERFSYYHFGTFLFGLPMRAAGVAPEYAYNVLAALLGGLAAGAAFGAIRLRRGGRRLAVFGAAFMVLSGTLDGAREALAGPDVHVDVWPSSRRVLNAITEWPLFTLWLGDLHPHAVALPLFVTWAALAGRVAGGAGVGLDAVVLGSLLSANPWDLPAAMLVLAAGNLAERPLVSSIARSVITVAVSLPVLLPFLLSPRPPFQGLDLWPGGTASWEAFLHFGPVIAVPALAIGIALVRSQSEADKALLMATLFPAVGIAVALLGGQPVFGLATGFVFAVLYLLPKLEGSLRAGFLLAMAGTLLATIPEIVVVKDPYGEKFKRMNTVFKTYAGAWPLLALGTALLLPLVLSSRRARGTIRFVLVVVFAGALLHPVMLEAGRWKARPGTLDGLAWLSREYPGDRKAVDWLRAHARPTDTLAEVSGGAYDDRGRIGTASGRPTLLGWSGHEGVWRGSDKIGPELAKRQDDLKAIYTSPDVFSVTSILNRRLIRFVVVGPLERKDFGENAFPARGAFRKVFEADGTALYEAEPR